MTPEQQRASRLAWYYANRLRYKTAGFWATMFGWLAAVLCGASGIVTNLPGLIIVYLSGVLAASVLIAVCMVAEKGGEDE